MGADIIALAESIKPSLTEKGIHYLPKPWNHIDFMTFASAQSPNEIIDAIAAAGFTGAEINFRVVPDSPGLLRWAVFIKQP